MENAATTRHVLHQGDARDMSFLEDASVHLAVTSPPYWNLKRYNENESQLGHINDYETGSLFAEAAFTIQTQTPEAAPALALGEKPGRYGNGKAGRPAKRTVRTRKTTG